MLRIAQVPRYTPGDQPLRKRASSSVRSARSALPDGSGIYQSRRRAYGYADDDWFGATSEYAARETTQPRAVRVYGTSRPFPETAPTWSRVIRCRHKARWTIVQAVVSPATRRVSSRPWCGITCAVVVHADGRWRAIQTTMLHRVEPLVPLTRSWTAQNRRWQ